MKRFHLSSLFLISLLSLPTCFLVGCGNDKPVESNRMSVTAEDFAARLDAANNISSFTDRDEALVGLAKDAAAAGEGTIARNAIQAIRTITTMNDATAEAAVLLAKNGNSAEATVVAKLIRSTSLRDETLARIATGD